jgi:hypothetical protein
MQKTKDEIVLEIYSIAKELLEIITDDSDSLEFELLRHKLRDLYEDYRD